MWKTIYLAQEYLSKFLPPYIRGKYIHIHLSSRCKNHLICKPTVMLTKPGTSKELSNKPIITREKTKTV